MVVGWHAAEPSNLLGMADIPPACPAHAEHKGRRKIGLYSRRQAYRHAGGR